jgi:hypothetical protein
MGYDLYPVETLGAKQHWLRMAVDEEYVIFFEHDPVVKSGLLTVVNGVRHVTPVLA